MPLREQLLAAFVAFIWGVAFIPVKLGVEEAPPLMLSALRFVFTAFPALLFVKPPRAPMKIIIAYGFALGVGQFGIVFTAIHLGAPVGMTSIVVQTQVFFTIALTMILFRERPLWFQIAGAVVAFAGVVLIGQRRAAGAELLPFLLVLAAAFCWGVANLIGKMAGRIDMLAFIVWSSLVSPIPLLLLSLWLDGPAEVMRAFQPSWTLILCVAALAWPATLVAFGIWSNLLSRFPAAAVAPFALLVPVFGLASAALVLGETITIVELFGGALVMLGLAVTIFGANLRRFFR
jgi:O-acetylserine/cysteine efflux transporter